MGYTLKIGELKTEVYDYEEDDAPYFYHTVETQRNEDAPAFNEPTDHTNERWPSYTAWANAMRALGLYDFMFNEESGLIRNHPDCVPLTKKHKEIIDKAYKEFYEKYPECKAGYSPNSTLTYNDPAWPEINSYAVRLEWLKYWVDWALENCKIPAFYNS